MLKAVCAWDDTPRLPVTLLMHRFTLEAKFFWSPRWMLEIVAYHKQFSPGSLQYTSINPIDLLLRLESLHYFGYFVQDNCTVDKICSLSMTVVRPNDKKTFN